MRRASFKMLHNGKHAGTLITVGKTRKQAESRGHALLRRFKAKPEKRRGR